MTRNRLILPALFCAILASALPAAAQTATPGVETAQPAPAQAPTPRMTSTLRIRDVGRVPEMGLCLGGCNENSTARRGTFTMQAACPEGLLITPFGTCVRMP